MTRSRVVAAALVVGLVLACSPGHASSPIDSDPQLTRPPVEEQQLLGKLASGRRQGVAPIRHTATGVMVCLAREHFPARVRNDAVISCDRRFGHGVITPIDYTADNSPEFAEFVQPIIDGMDDLIMSSVDLVIDECGPRRCSTGGFGEWMSVILTGPLEGLDVLPKVDLRGRTLSLIRLSGWVELTPSPEGNAYVYDLVWEFYGK